MANLQGQIMHLMKQLDVQKEISLTGIELFKHRESILQSKISQLAQQLGHEQEHRQKLEHQLENQQVQVQKAFETVSRHFEERLATTEQEMENKLNKELQSLHTSVVNHLEKRMNMATDRLEDMIDKQADNMDKAIQQHQEQITLRFQQTEQLLSEQNNQQQQNVQQVNELKTYMHPLLNRMDMTEHHISIQNKQLHAVDARLADIRTDITNSEKRSETSLSQSIEQMITAMDIFKSSLSLLQKDQVSYKKQMLEDMLLVKEDWQQQLAKTKEQLRKEMRYMEKPLLVV